MFIAVTAIITAVVAYLIGSVNSAVILSTLVYGKDVREEGSGNPGATNMLRTHGKIAALITLIGDVLKGIIAILLSLLIVFLCTRFAKEAGGESVSIFGQIIEKEQIGAIYQLMTFVAGFFAVVGHDFPIFFKFKGGKGVATGLGVMMFLNWQVGLIVLAVSLIIMAVTRYVSVGSIAAALLYIVVDTAYMIFTNHFTAAELIFVVCMALLLIWRHKANIVRLKNGTENKLGQKKSA